MCVECKYTCIEICCGCTAYLGGKRFFANAAFEGAFLRVAAVVDLKCRLARERLQADLARGIAANACAPHTDKRGTVEDGENGGKKKNKQNGIRLANGWGICVGGHKHLCSIESRVILYYE